ncbi:hypothetical protein [Caldicoprobacter faecalis]|uniref:Uncharacterized protein n=1 Tax=Caldicoprobacter faecalis TaxID=937334 RepID=A0A1I5RJ95_9FIRM|nr:hypothetical protein [Caldicoprobacter faecalis]SFP58605.1 hypothetical protein SAMN05444406_10111 [Caldicoprobacter faecalis]
MDVIKFEGVKEMKYYHQIKRLGPEMKNIEEKEERHDLIRKLSNDRDAKNKKYNSTLTVE